MTDLNNLARRAAPFLRSYFLQPDRWNLCSRERDCQWHVGDELRPW